MDNIARLILLLIVSALCACGEFIRDDKDFRDNRRSVDIDSDNAESLMWTAYMAGVEAFRQSALYFGITPNDFGAQSGTYACSGGGQIDFDFSKNAGERLLSGDTFDVQYSDCVNDSGERANGRVHGKYSSIEGYNSSFDLSLDVDECIARVLADEAPSAPVIEDSADQVVFVVQGTTIQVVYRNQIDATTQEDVASYAIGLNDTVVVLNRSQTVPSSSRLQDDAQLFLVRDQEAEAVDCDRAQVEGTMQVSNLRVEGDEIISTLDFVLSFDYHYRAASNEDYVFDSDSADITVEKGGYKEQLSLIGVEWSLERDTVSSGAYSMSVSGEMLGDAVPGITEIAVIEPIRGPISDALPTEGQLRVLGVGFERSTINIDDSVFIRFSVAPEGDVSGNLRADTAPLFSTSWADFLVRNFLRPELIVTTQ